MEDIYALSDAQIQKRYLCQGKRVNHVYDIIEEI